jgi:two-component system, OmpR family, phosphate regulon response regulator OmpR
MKPRNPLPDEAPHVLVIDDDRRLRELLSRFLGDNGYRVSAAANAADAGKHLSGITFDALVLDVMMPGENGFEFARRMRQGSGPEFDRKSSVPILMLTARADASDRVKGLEIGVDDYLPKPFEPRELLLRLGNIIRRGAPAAPAQAGRPDLVRFGPFVYWPERGELRRGEENVRLTEREREMLTMLAYRLGEPVTRDELGASDSQANERTVDVQINRLRRKIERDPADPLLLQTVRGVGYRLMVDRG